MLANLEPALAQWLAKLLPFLLAAAEVESHDYCSCSQSIAGAIKNLGPSSPEGLEISSLWEMRPQHRPHHQSLVPLKAGIKLC